MYDQSSGGSLSAISTKLTVWSVYVFVRLTCTRLLSRGSWAVLTRGQLDFDPLRACPELSGI